jgi:hypothetical protein
MLITTTLDVLDIGIVYAVGIKNSFGQLSYHGFLRLPWLPSTWYRIESSGNAIAT